MYMFNIHHRPPLVHTKIPALLILIEYALTHGHSRQWIGAIQAILGREGHDG